MTTGGVLVDVLLLSLLAYQAFSGWRQGLLIGAVSLTGFVVGLLGGGWLTVRLLETAYSGSALRVIAALAGGLLGGVLLQSVGIGVAHRLRERIESRGLRAADTVVGMLAAVLAASLVAWVITWGLRSAPLPQIGAALGQSRVVTLLDTVAPDPAKDAADRFFSRVSGEWFPRVFADGQESIRPVEPPDGSVATAAGVVAAAPAVVKITGLAEACNRGVEGSGFVVAPGLVVTNAHVVASVEEPRVQPEGRGDRLPARIVAFDPDRDLAVLRVPGLTAQPLPLGGEAAAGTPVAVAGFPNDGPYDVGAGRVREQIRAVGEDIYGTEGVPRQVYSLYAPVRPGNSGGPVLSATGEVIAVVFARSTTDADTGYALTLAELRPVLESVSDTPVPAGPCAVG